MSALWIAVVAFALIGVLLIAGFVKHVRESAASARRIEQEVAENRERLNRELIAHLREQLHQSANRARAYPIAARSAPPNTAQQNGVPENSTSASHSHYLPSLVDYADSLKHSSPAQSGPAEACNSRSFADDSSRSSYSCDSASSYDSSSSSSSCDSSSSSSCGGGGE